MSNIDSSDGVDAFDVYPKLEALQQHVSNLQEQKLVTLNFENNKLVKSKQDNQIDETYFGQVQLSFLDSTPRVTDN